MVTGLQMFVLVRVTVNAPPVRVSLARVTRNRHSYQCECTLRLGILDSVKFSSVISTHASCWCPLRA